jgi:hypothetical protein
MVMILSMLVAGVTFPQPKGIKDLDGPRAHFGKRTSGVRDLVAQRRDNPFGKTIGGSTSQAN